MNPRTPRPFARSAVLVTAASALLLSTTPSRAGSVAALWHMDDASVMSDSSGNGNDGTTSAITLETPGYDGTGGAYSFDGSSSVVIVPNSDSLNPGSSDVTMVAHAKFTDDPGPTVGDYDLVRKKGKKVQYKMEIIRGARPYCIFGGDVDKAAISLRRNLADGEWHTITCSKTSSRISIQVDGGRTKAKTVTIGSISNSGSVILGREGSTGDWFAGQLDEVSILIG